MQNSDKGQYWTIIIFEDNWKKIPDWKDRLIATHFRFCISPLHNKDTWSEDDIIKHPDREDYIKKHLGEPKTPHYHVMIHCDQNTTWKTMKDLTSSMNLPVPFVVRAPYGLYHYFTHEFNLEKAPYDPNDIKHYNGSDPSDYLMEMSRMEITNYRYSLAQRIRAAGCLTYGEMEDIARSMPNPNYQYVFQNSVSYFRQYLVDNIAADQRKRGKYRDAP